MTNGRKIDIDRIVDSLNRLPKHVQDAVLPVFQEEFPDLLWTRMASGVVDVSTVSINCMAETYRY